MNGKGTTQSLSLAVVTAVKDGSRLVLQGAWQRLEDVWKSCSSCSNRHSCFQQVHTVGQGATGNPEALQQ